MDDVKKPFDKAQGKPTIELRSDLGENVEKLKGVATGFVPSGGGGGKGSDKKKWLLIGGGVFLVLIVILLVTAVMSGGSGGGGDEQGGLPESGGVFGNLPLVGDLGPDTESGLSGRTCERADRRPIGVMLAGDPINRPVSGFEKADMVWELPVLVSGVTRLLAVYQCGEPADIGSVRSARHDYLFLAEGVDAIVGHWGGSYHALNRIDAGEFQSLNALGNPFGAFFRKTHLPAPYNGFTTYENLWSALEQLGYRTESEFDGYDFEDDAPEGERGAAGTLSIAWPGQFRVHYEYDPVTNRYQRYWAGVRQVDGDEDGKDVAPSVVAIMRATNEFADGAGGYNDVGIEGSGRLDVYQNGQVISGTWEKNELYKNDPVKFLDEDGKEITFVRGQVWVMAPTEQTEVTWDPTPPADAGSAGQGLSQ